jgi:hypothetical protein
MHACFQQAESDRKRDTKPSPTLFVVNFDVNRVRERDLDRFYEYYGRIKRVMVVTGLCTLSVQFIAIHQSLDHSSFLSSEKQIEIKKNYAFVQVCICMSHSDLWYPL